ncbi:TMEM175 family protein [Peptostreptococcus faecalis]|uniref:TMEM175 family protein n=1 Tax=Peptostreptococcus faecalis TaxID=2045015 RepID=UPI000C7998FB|nr:TMEM175 family protein [Peptostreptococcus faecalis]
MTKSRMEAFTDAIIAIIMTILVLNLTPPVGDSIRDLAGVERKLLVYLFSFAILAVYWINHHHLFQLVKSVNARVLWANNLLIFCLTLFPFTTAWISTHLFSLIPQFMYGTVILMADIAYLILSLSLIDVNQECKILYNRELSRKKNLISILFNILALILGVLINPIFVCVVNFFMILMWVVPNKKIEKKLSEL